ncbi:hypothetical protein [Corallococcus sicarius]|nr:hypothetical protein [Corallococcus sicarius]
MNFRLARWALPKKGVMSIQYESTRYAPRRAGLIGRFSQKGRQDLVNEF